VTETKDDRDVDVFETDEVDREGEKQVDLIKLPSADLLSTEGVDELLRRRPAYVVAILGERKGGKTTLITEIYERFLRGSFGGQLFADSQTLHGFEKKTYSSRAETGAEKPDTARTSRSDGLKFFHLGLHSERLGLRRDLLISERAGEIYREFRDNPGGDSALVELQRARTAVFILDGERVASNQARAEAFASVRGMLRAFSDHGVLPTSAEIQVVTTKFDLLSGNSASDAVSALADFEARIVKAYSDRFAKVTCWHTAARDPTGKFEPAWGVSPLLESWLNPPVSQQTPSVQLPELDNEFDRLLVRRIRLA
jgi:hypothetical protein